MTGIQAGNAGRLSIEIVAEVARLQADMDKVRRLVKDASGDIAKNAKAANDNLAAIGTAGGKGVQQFARDIAQLKSQLDPAWAAQQKFNDQQRLGMQALKQGAIDRQQFITHMRQINAELKNSIKPNQQLNASIGAQRAGMQQLGFQLQDFTVQVAGGTSATRAFAQQFPQAIGAVTLMAGETSKLGRFLGGPWGIAIAVGAAALVPLLDKLFETKGALDDVGDAADSAAKKLRDSLNQASVISDVATDSLKKLFTAQGQLSKVAQDIALAEKLLQSLGSTPGGAQAAEGMAQRLAALYARKQQIEKDIKSAQGDLDQVRLTAATQAMQDKAYEANYNKQKETSEKTIRLAKVTGAEIAKALGAPITSGFRTKEVNDAVKGAKNSYHLTGQAIDIPLSVGGRPFTKAGIRAALAPLGVQIKELLGPGDKGHNDHFHIAFGVKRLAPDQVAKLETDAAEAAAKAADKAKNELEKFRTDVLATSYEMESALAKAMLPGFLAAEQRVWDGFVATVEKSANAGVEGAAEAQQAWAYWNDELRNTVDLLDDIGTSGRGLGDIAATIAGLTSGDWSGSRGPLGSLLQTLGNTQWRDPADANGLGQIRVLREEIVKGLDKVFGGKGTFSKTMNSLLQGAGMGMAAGSLVSGGKQTKTQQVGSAVGGALGKVAGEEVGKMIGGTLGKFAGPLGAIAGGILGNVIGGLFKKVKWGRVDLTSAGVSATSGNSGAAEKAALQTGNSIFNGLKDLATQLGGVLGDFGSIAVGVRNGDYRVNSSGTSLKIKKGAVNFEDDAEAAAAYAMKQAIERGAITGIRNSTNNLLKAGDDLQAQLQKAMSFEGVFTELKGITDPVGAALDEVNKQFDQLRVVFKEAGATAEEYAQLEQLLSIRRQEALDKEKDALDDIRSRIAEAQGDDATVKLIARTKELKDALNDNVRAELQRLYAVEDATEAQQKLTDAQAEAAAKADQLRDAWASIGADLMDEVNRIRGLTGGDSAASYAMLKGQFNAAVGAARGGDQAAAGKLSSLSQSLIEAAQNAATSRQELDRVKAETAAMLEGVARLAGAPAPQTTDLPSGNSQSDNVSSELREAREEIAAMRTQMMSALATIASNTGRTANKLDDVTSASGGDAISVANAA